MTVKEKFLTRAAKRRTTPRTKRIHKRREDVTPTGNVGDEDPYRIGPTGGSNYGSSFVIVEKYNGFEFDKHTLLGRGEKSATYPGKYVRRAKFRLTFKCCTSSGKISQTARNDALITIDVIIQDVYDSRTQAKDRGSMNYWFKHKSRESSTRISDGECKDWNSALKGCHRSILIEDVIKIQEPQ